MPSKTINVSVEAYEAMQAAKEPGESFSQLALRTFRPADLWDLAGILTSGEAQHLRQDMEDSRKRSRRRSDRMDARWSG